MSDNIKNIFSRNLRRLLDQQDKTQLELAEFLGVSNTTVNNYVKGYNSPRMDRIDKICEFFGVERSVLLNPPELEIIGKVEKAHSYPYIPDPISAGIPCNMEGLTQLPTLSVYDYLLGRYAGSDNIVMMKINGESMNKVVPNNSLIGVYYDYPVHNLKDGDIVVFRQDYDYSLKHYYDGGDKIIFKPNSNDISFTDIVCSKDESVNIIGKVVMYAVLVT